MCGGDVIDPTDGAWMSVLPPPPPKCSKCGATVARGPVLPMVPAIKPLPKIALPPTRGKSTNGAA